MRQSPSTLRRPTVSRNKNPSLSMGLLDESGPHHMIATAEGYVRGRGNGEFSKVEGRTGLTVTEKQIPGLFVGFDAPALKWRRQVEHHHILVVVRKNGGKIVPANSVGPALEKGFDPGFFGVGRHGFGLPVATQGRIKAGKSDKRL